ncbi:hypothetical protein [Novosphingobium sp.]|uniref:hypothetical protein n=1 Tax=Novosphingobium sp. TaxID=1874826 RepID=UPI00261F7A88|nr:hypothetical protein [Novosphingobium sp.]
MPGPPPWDIDRIAAADLLNLLRGAREEEWLGLATEALSRHRRQANEWAAKRVHRAAIDALEAGSSREFHRHDAIWADGFRAAEQCLCQSTPAQLLGMGPPEPVSQGQVLRGLIRAARAARTTKAEA